MKKVNSLFLVFLIVLIVVSFSTLPFTAKAIGFTPFGGFVVSMLPCTCSGNFWLQMSPFFFPTPGAGALVYQPGGTIVYAHYVIPVPGVWLLGDYTPGVQACYQYVGVSCVPIPSFGVIHQTGTSL